MALWERVRSELEQAGRVAQGAIDEGRLRLEIFRARKRADRAAQQLGWLYYRARAGGTEPDAEQIAKIAGEIAVHDAEAKRLEEQIAEITRQAKATP